MRALYFNIIFHFLRIMFTDSSLFHIVWGLLYVHKHGVMSLKNFNNELNLRLQITLLHFANMHLLVSLVFRHIFITFARHLNQLYMYPIFFNN